MTEGREHNCIDQNTDISLQNKRAGIEPESMMDSLADMAMVLNAMPSERHNFLIWRLWDTLVTETGGEVFDGVGQLLPKPFIYKLRQRLLQRMMVNLQMTKVDLLWFSLESPQTKEK